MRIVVLDDYQGVAAAYAAWGDLAADVVFVSRPITSDDDLVMLLRGAEVVVAMRERTTFTAGRLQRLPDLRLLVTTGMVNGAIDLEAARQCGVVVCGTESPASATPELTWGLILASLRNIPSEDAKIREGSWQTTVGGDLAGRRLGVVGLGRLGTKVARIGAAFEMDVVAWSQNLTAAKAAEVGVRAVSKEELFTTSDVITLHYKLSERSRGLVGSAELSMMRSSAILVNTSRGQLIETPALIEALREKRIGGAALDVFDVEPLPKNDVLRAMPRTVLTPHLGYVTDGTYQVFYAQAVEAIRAWIAGSFIRELT